jgi:HEAT repeat protein
MLKRPGQRQLLIRRNYFNALMTLALIIAAVIQVPAVARGFAAGNTTSDNSSRTPQQPDADAATVKAIREARELIADERWAEAVAKLSQVVDGRAPGSHVDAALYWLAFALKKQNKASEADRALVRLIEEFPDSSWTADARALRVEIAPQLSTSETINEEAIKDDNDEVKLIALQNLFQTNPARATTLVADILKPSSGASRILREGAIILLGQQDDRQASALLLQIVNHETDSNLRKQAIMGLAYSDDPTVLEVLKDIVQKTDDEALLEACLYAISAYRGERAVAVLIELAKSAKSAVLREKAVLWLGQRNGEPVVIELMKIYEANPDLETRQHVLIALFGHKSKSSLAQILKLAATEKNLSLRQQAIDLAAQTNDGQAIEKLIQVYLADNSDQIKGQILLALSQSKDERALKLLMDVARGDASVVMRQKAIFLLGQSDQPAAAKFLESIRKQNPNH